MFHAWTDSKRAAEILGVFLKMGGGGVLTRLGLQASSADDGSSFDPAKLRTALEQLGPVFIKLGQILSTRGDILPDQWARELARLQSGVAPLPWDIMRPRIEAAIGQPIEAVFKTIEPEPVGSASIAQVYRATRLDGRDVVIKVTRPDQEVRIASDLRLLAQAAQRAESFSEEARRYRPQELVSHLARAIKAELDLTEEAQNGQEVASNLQHMPEVSIPAVHMDLSSRDVMVQDFIAGITLRDAEQLRNQGLDPVVLAQRGARAFLQGVLVDRVFHADPHPGNMFALPDNRVAFIDFGMVGRLTASRQRELLSLLRAIVTKDAPSMSKVLKTWNQGEPANPTALEEGTARFVARHAKVGLDLARAVADIMDMIRQAGLTMPSDMALLFKAMVTADGVMKMLDPQFDTIAAARPFVQQELLGKLSPQDVADKLMAFGQKSSELAEQAPDLFQASLETLANGRVSGRIDIRQIEQLSASIEKGSTKLALAVVLAALIWVLAPYLLHNWFG